MSYSEPYQPNGFQSPVRPVQGSLGHHLGPEPGITANAAHQLLLGTDHTLVHAASDSELLYGFCRDIAAHWPCQLVWAGVLENNLQALRPMAHAGPAEAFYSLLLTSWQELDLEKAIVARLLSDGPCLVVEDVRRQDGGGFWKLADRHGLRSCLAVPLTVGGSVWGTLTLHGQDVREFDASQRELLRHVVEKLCFGLEVLRLRKQRQRALDALRQSEGRFRKFAETIPEVVWLSNADFSRLLYVNPAFEELWGRSRQSVLADPAVAISAIHPDDISPVSQRLSRFIEKAHQEPCTTDEEFRILRPDQTIRHVHARVYSVHDAQGHLGGICGVVVDVTSRRQAQENRQRLASIVMTIDDGICSISAQGMILTWNGGAERIWGYRLDEVQGQPVTKLIAAESVTQVKDLFQRLSGGERVHGEELHGLTKARKVVPLSLAVSPVTDEAGKLIGFSAIAHDISERKRLEQEVLRISEMEQERIGQDLHDSLGQTLTGVNLLAGALAKTLSRKKLPESSEAEQIALHVKKAISLTRSLARGLTPMGTGPESLMNGLGDLVQQVRDTNSRIAAEFLCDDRVRLNSREVSKHLYHIAQESINNAIKHARCNSITVRLGERNGLITLSIADDGVGLPARSRKRKGMGLNIMTYRANMIGASLEVRPGPEGGTVITCRLPQAPVLAKQLMEGPPGT